MQKEPIIFETVLKQFGAMGEKSGWTYIEIPPKCSETMNPGTKVSFRVRGKIDEIAIKQQALLPMGGGNFIMAVKADLRKKLKKKKGDQVSISISVDKSELTVLKSFVDCLKDEPLALQYFQAMPASHQHYYSKWIESAKTEITRVKRIAIAVNTLAKKLNYSEMLRSQKKEY